MDDELLAIQDIVGSIKQSKKTEDRYMTLQEMIDHSYEDGVQRGIQQGIIRSCQSFRLTKEKTIEVLKTQCELDDDEASAYIELYWNGENGN